MDSTTGQSEVKNHVQLVKDQMDYVCDLLDAMKRLELDPNDVNLLCSSIGRLNTSLNDCKAQIGLAAPLSDYGGASKRTFQGGVTRASNDEIFSQFNTQQSVDDIIVPSDHNVLYIAGLNDIAQQYWEETDVQQNKKEVRRGLSRAALRTLNDGQMVESQALDGYFTLIQKRSEKPIPSLPKTYVMSDSFYPLLHKFGYNAVYDATGSVDIFAKDLIFCPIHEGDHYYLVVADNRCSKLVCYDSMRGTSEDYMNKRNDTLNRVHSYLSKEYFKRRLVELDTSWNLIVKERHEVPQQGSGTVDCGVFICKFADYIATDQEPDFTHEHVPFFRRLMVSELLEQNLCRQPNG